MKNPYGDQTGADLYSDQQSNEHQSNVRKSNDRNSNDQQRNDQPQKNIKDQDPRSSETNSNSLPSQLSEEAKARARKQFFLIVFVLGISFSILFYFAMPTIKWKPVDPEKISAEVESHVPVLVCFYDLHPNKATDPNRYFNHSDLTRVVNKYSVSCYWADNFELTQAQAEFRNKYINNFHFSDAEPPHFFFVFFVPGKQDPILMDLRSNYWDVIDQHLKVQPLFLR